MDLLYSLFIGLVVGVIITIPLGPISIYVAQQTLTGHTRKGLHVAVGSVIIDIVYCLVITLGFISLVSPWLGNPWVQVGLSILLMLYGVSMLVGERRKTRDAKEGPQLTPETQKHATREHLEHQRESFERRHYFVLLGVTMALANPTLFVSWTAVLSFVSAHGMLVGSFWDKVLFSLATGVGSFAWFLGLALFVRSRRHSLSPTFIKRAGTVTALVIIGFGVYFTFNVFSALNGTA